MFWQSVKCVHILLMVVVVLYGCENASQGGAQKMRTPPDTLYSVILAGGIIYDGTGDSPVQTDIGIVGNQILAFGDLTNYNAENRIDISGLAVTPGFIDIHSHAVGGAILSSGLYRNPEAENYLRQGVTTVIVGQDGSSAYPIDEYLSQLAKIPAAINVGTMIGHGTVRAIAMGNRDREANATDMDRMKRMVLEAMNAGAFGLSSGLEYSPGAYASTEELIELTKVVKPFNGIYISHIRNEGGELLESVAETIRIGEEAGVPPQITHHKVVGNGRFGKSRESLAMIEEARKRGVDAMSDVYPYTASSTGINILLPPWSKEGTRSERVARLRDPEKRIFVRNDVMEHIEEERGGDPSTIVIANCSWDRSLNGKSLADILEERGMESNVLNAANLAIELEIKGGCMGVFHSMGEEDVARIMKHSTTMIASDGGIPGFGRGAPHPRSYGTFARVLAHYARDEGILKIEDAVHKMSGLPARRLGLENRGVLQEGAIADIAVIDMNTIQDHASFENAHQYATGVKHVFVGGQAVLLDAELTGQTPGTVLRKQ